YAVPFYRDVLAPALKQMRDSWDAIYIREFGEPFPDRENATSHIGTIVMLALERRLAATPRTSYDMALQLVATEEFHLRSAIAAVSRRRTPGTKAPSTKTTGTKPT
ncbi:MAG TPA: hypothetical protein PLV68_08690, partial [Ilumatobacteraceae bacterium]|nr:hypothetical protein [Ilumatobacteraceae bacterium]